MRVSRSEMKYEKKDCHDVYPYTLNAYKIEDEKINEQDCFT